MNDQQPTDTDNITTNQNEEIETLKSVSTEKDLLDYEPFPIDALPDTVREYGEQNADALGGPLQ